MTSRDFGLYSAAIWVRGNVDNQQDDAIHEALFIPNCENLEEARQVNTDHLGVAYSS